MLFRELAVEIILDWIEEFKTVDSWMADEGTSLEAYLDLRFENLVECMSADYAANVAGYF
jgi:hypothetical protein